MILLTFSSAAKLILSLLLATLGIIPYEQIDFPDHKESSPTAGYHLGLEPIGHLSAKLLPQEIFQDMIPEAESFGEFIHLRSDFLLENSYCEMEEEIEWIQFSTKTIHHLVEHSNKIVLIIDEDESRPIKNNNFVFVKASL